MNSSDYTISKLLNDYVDNLEIDSKETKDRLKNLLKDLHDEVENA